ncbi:MAG: T9SS type A sorting domain-containing protein [Bacteroidetes bacterium]|nr:T9SS type A sorting domain-containing protein [Bacteroidota bacterium]
MVNTIPPVSISVNGNTLSSFGAFTYQWIFNGTPINGATDSIYLALQDGSYQVSITDESGCSALSNSVNVVVSNLEDLMDSSGFTLYPNPVRDQLTITGLDFSNRPVYPYHLFDYTGRKLKSGMFIKHQSFIDMKEFTSGMYLLEVGGTIRKFIKE